MVFLFDMDGTLTIRESFPLIASLSGDQSVMKDLTMSALTGEDEYESNLLQRIDMVSGIPVDKVSETIAGMSLRPGIVEFIKEHKYNCAVVTSNLDCWVRRLLSSLGCRFFCSKAKVVGGIVSRVEEIIKKEEIVAYYQDMGEKTVFIGDGSNDRNALIQADLSVAFLASPYADRRLGEICDYSCEDEKSLLELLKNLK